MHLVQLLLPLYDNGGRQFPQALYLQTRSELVERFGGLTAYTRAPVRGLWQDSGQETVRDDLVIYEVMTEELDMAWWGQYRTWLEARFEQERIVVRAHDVRML
jgi:hypothetical protein